MLQALVHSQIPDPDKPAFDDFIEGKGKGLIVLLQYYTRRHFCYRIMLIRISVVHRA